jgi:hypothetical protein
MVYTCHCNDCASPPVPSRWVLRVIESVADSGRIKRRYMCMKCGVWVCGPPRPDPLSGRVIRVARGGTFDDTSWLRPTLHFWTRSKQIWVILPDGDRRYDTQPH